MSFIGIISSEKQTQQIKKEIGNQLKDLKVEIICINSKSIENIKNIKFETIIIYDNLEKLKQQETYIKEIILNSKYLVLNADANINSQILKNINVKTITYGLNQKATITASSIGENEIIICIQRAFKNLYNKVIEQQEIRANLENNNIRNIYDALIKVIIINIYKK